MVVVFKQLNYEEDLITTNFLHTVARGTDPCQAHEVADLLIGKHDALHSEILKCSQQHPKQKIIIIASSLNYDSLQQQFSSLPDVRVLLSN